MVEGCLGLRGAGAGRPGDEQPGPDHEEQPRDLGGGQDLLRRLPLPQAGPVDGRENDDQQGRENRRRAAAQREELRRVVTEDERQQRDRTGLENRHPRPGEEEGGFLPYARRRK